ncbi:MAG: MAPEG family protein [Burkholderiales bacterium]|nr:MAPEG family protein [Burkholderiales bacterium]
MMLSLAGVLLVVQLIVADLAAIRSKHKAGYPIAADSTRFLFRSARAHINTNESIAAFALLGFVGVLLNASPAWLNGLAVLWLASRLAHMGFYYANWKPLRSLAFAVSLVALLGLAVTDLASW